MGQKSDKKKKPLAKKRKTSRAKLIRDADKVFADYMKLKAGKCEWCGKPECQPLNNHHGVVHRRYMNTRYEPDNCAVVGVSCHWFLGNFPRINTEFFEKRIGKDRMEQLEIAARSGRKVTNQELEDIILDYRDRIRNLEK